MSITTARTEIDVRPYEQGDEDGVLDLLKVALGPGPSGSRTKESFRWKHLENPFGHSLMLVAEADGQIVGLRAFMRWRFELGDRSLRAVRAVDTATHPDFQRMGVFSRLTRAALEQLRDQADLVFNTPNEKSGPGYEKLGWRAVGRVPVSVRVRRPVRFLRGIRSESGEEPRTGGLPPIDAPLAADVLAEEGPFAGLLAALDGSDRQRLRTPRSFSYLRWRYADPPHLGYRAVTETANGRITGVAFFRIRPRGKLLETTVADLLVEERRTASALIRRVVTAAAVDHVACSFPRRSIAGRAARRRGFVPLPGPMRLMVNPLHPGLPADPTRWSSWALSLGDLEVF